MASPKFLIFACAVLLVQAQAHPQPHVGSLITDLIKDLVPLAEKGIDWMYDSASRIVNEASTDPIAYQKETLEKFEKVLDRALDLFNKGLDKIKERSSPVTGKAIDCVKDAREQVDTLAVAFYDKTTQCIAPEVNDLIKKIANILPDVGEIKTKAYAAADKVQDCSGTNAEEAICVAGVAEGILDVLRSTESEVIQKALDIILSLVNNLEKHIPNCIKPNGEQAVEEAIKTLDSVTACIAA